MRDNQRDGHEELERAAHGNGFAVGARTAARRRVTQQVQLEAALMRYSAALARDRAAEARDRDADERDRIAAGHDAALETLGRTDPALATRLADAFTDLRRAAAEQRSAAAADRDLAAHDRRRAAADSEVLAHLVALSETDSLTGARMRGPGLADL